MPERGMFLTAVTRVKSRKRLIRPQRPLLHTPLISIIEREIDEQLR